VRSLILHFGGTRRPAVIHRDLTSLNILVDKDWHCKACYTPV
jgi:hypothetical protein